MWFTQKKYILDPKVIEITTYIDINIFNEEYMSKYCYKS